MPKFPWVSPLSESINFGAGLHDVQDLRPDELSSGSVLVGLVMHNKSVLWALAGRAVCVWIVLFGNLAGKGSANGFPLAVISPAPP